MSQTGWGWLVLAFPLAGAIILGLGYRVWPGRAAGWLGTLMIALSFGAALAAFLTMMGHVPDHRQVEDTAYNYAATAGVDVKLTILIDPLSVMMMLIVSGVSTLIHLYSVSYMTKDEGYTRFFAYLNFFVFSMLLLVEAGNFAILIVGWAFVGAASYLLISFWYRRTTATRAGIKAFVINVVGDIGLVAGTYFIFRGTHTLDFLQTFKDVNDAFAVNDGSLVAGCVLLLVGAFAKSAQIPLHTWLPDAMEGPTPVSSLIHAATMVTAGVYLIARMHPLFQQAPAAGDVGEVIGAVTLVVAATMGLVMTDLKRVIAYSTMSQIGYMIMGVSAGAYAAGMFHLFTHAFFKALLFMAAGSLIGAMAGEQSLDRMGGFRKAMPYTFGCFVIGGLALSAVPPFSGFFSKDEILATVGSEGGWHIALYVAGYVTAFMTAVYTFRIIFRAFYGAPVPEAVALQEGHIHHAEHPFNPGTGEAEDNEVGFPGPEHFIAERERPMKIAMGLLAVGCVVNGLVQVPGVDNLITRFLRPSFANTPLFDQEASSSLTLFGVALGTVMALTGIALAYFIWVKRPGTSAALQKRFAGVHTLFSNKWYFDEILDAIFVRPAAWFGRFCQQTFERVFVNGVMVGGPTAVVRAGSAAVRAAQSGLLRLYAALLVLGLTGTILYFLLESSS